MIYDKLTEIARYRGLSEHLDKAIRFLQTADLASLPMGRTEIAGSDVYCNHFTYTTAPISPDSLFEDHSRYLDLHVPLSGRERIAVTPTQLLTQVEVRADEDSVMYRGEPEHTFILDPDRFLLVYPGESHLPKLLFKAPEDVDKLVVKIAF